MEFQAEKERSLEMTEHFFQTQRELNPLRDEILAAAALLAASYRKGGQVLICGNGGSSSDAEHIVGELMKGFLLKRPLPPEDIAWFERQYGPAGRSLAENLQGALPAIALGAHSSLTSAVANDLSADSVYAQGVMGYGGENSVLIGISTSGNAKNVIAAAMTARFRKMKVIGLTGKTGGGLRPLCDICLSVPETETYLVQQQHLALYHFLAAWVESELF
ncbi:MAG: SIS domain-containing protein [Treponema sp.]|jgi:D-sedoheptulose 7-phosphate isomerase|nr:SIS domain-containing protein [Treponema sp.]